MRIIADLFKAKIRSNLYKKFAIECNVQFLIIYVPISFMPFI